MKLASFNINGINQRLDSLLNWLAVSRPDVVCLQELKAADNQFPLKAIREAEWWASPPVTQSAAPMFKLSPHASSGPIR